MSGTGPLVVLAPDKFKGSATAAEVAAALERGLLRSGAALRIVRRPIADGGEGTVDLLIEHGWEPREAAVTGPLGEPVTARWAHRGTTAVVEAAAACGLGLLPGPPTPETARAATTTGVGEMIRSAREAGVRRVVVGIGGTASTDGGRGAVEVMATEPWPDGVRLEVACDVRNPLLGREGAAVLYAPQKGADPSTVVQLEERLAAWAAALAARAGRDLATLAGAGAGGGLAYGLAAGLGATIVPGLATLLQLTGTAELVRRADLLIVGEGSLDAQSLYGKGPVALAGLAAEAGVPVAAVVGRSLVDPADAAAVGIGVVHALLDLEPDPARCVARTQELVEQVGTALGSAWADRDPGRAPAAGPCR